VLARAFRGKSHSGGIYHFPNERTRNFTNFAAPRKPDAQDKSRKGKRSLNVISSPSGFDEPAIQL
jgi:hypothetical protein